MFIRTCGAKHRLIGPSERQADLTGIHVTTSMHFDLQSIRVSSHVRHGGHVSRAPSAEVSSAGTRRLAPTSKTPNEEIIDVMLL